MAENIFKVYPGGIWHNEPDCKRLEHVIAALERYNNGNSDDYDYRDLVWHIKNAVIGNIYFSEEVARFVDEEIYWPGWKKNTQKDYCVWIKRILDGNTTKEDGTFDESLLKIREYLGISCGNLRFEHIIPAKVYVPRLIDLHKNKSLDSESFKDFRDKIRVCIVTKDQDDSLNEKHLRQDMPHGWDWSKDIFARYKQAKIEIHGCPYNCGHP